MDNQNVKKFNAGVDNVFAKVNRGGDAVINTTAMAVATVTKIGLHSVTKLTGLGTKILGDATIVAAEAIGSGIGAVTKKLAQKAEAVKAAAIEKKAEPVRTHGNEPLTSQA